MWRSVMTRKHFIAFADEIAMTGLEWSVPQRRLILRMLKRSNPNFDRERFMLRAGWTT